MLDTDTADTQAKRLIQEALGLGWPESGAHSRYCDLQGRKRRRLAASHVRTDVYYGAYWNEGTPLALWDIARTLAQLPGAVAVGMFPGDEGGRLLRPYSWVLRSIDGTGPSLADLEERAWKQAVTDRAAAEAVTPKRRHLVRGHTNNCARCGRAFGPVRIDARYCSNACRQKAYREQGGDA